MKNFYNSVDFQNKSDHVPNLIHNFCAKRTLFSSFDSKTCININKHDLKIMTNRKSSLHNKNSLKINKIHLPVGHYDRNQLNIGHKNVKLLKIHWFLFAFNQ